MSAVTLAATATQTAIEETVGKLLAGRYDFDARRAALAAAGPSALWATLAELGLLGIEVGEAAGGIGGSFADTAVVLQAFGRALVVEPFVPTAVLGVGLLNELASPGQTAALMPRVVAGTLKLAMAHQESDVRRIATTAVKTPDGWRLRGSKSLVLGGDVADLLIVSAGTAAGISLFLVPAVSAGVVREGYKLYDDHGAADLRMDAIVPDDALLGTAGEAQPAIDLAWDRGAAAAIHESVGAMERLCAMTPAYLSARVQFGQPLSRFQVLQHRMVDMSMALEQSRSMALLAGAALNGADPAMRARDISAAKLFVGDAARLVGQAAIQSHGGIALTDDYPAGHYFKRLTMLARQFGDELHHLDRYTGLMA